MEINRIIMSGWLSVCFVFVCFVCVREKERYLERERERERERGVFVV
jgi:hypothetical protein